MKSRRRSPVLRRTAAPFLVRIESVPEKVEREQYPFNIRAFSGGIALTFRNQVTFLVGENGSGRSTLLEALAECCGFNPEGGSRDHHRATFADRSPLAQALRLSWKRKVTEGFFMRAESFYNFASYIEQVSDLRAYGGKSLHEQSHGESFISLFANRFEQGIYPGAVLFNLDGDAIEEIEYRETKHSLITRDFLNSPERFFKHLVGTVDDHEDGV